MGKTNGWRGLPVDGCIIGSTGRARGGGGWSVFENIKGTASGNLVSFFRWRENRAGAKKKKEFG